jgi:hypothetical protein
MNYQSAFNQTDIHKKFAPLMQAWGCADNVFGSTQDTNPQQTAAQTNLDEQQKQKLEQEYQNACLSKLRNAQWWTFTEDARESFSSIALDVGAALLLKSLVKLETLGGSLGVYALLNNLTYIIKPAIRAGYTLMHPPANTLDRLEKRFALTQCFIPKPLWPIIIEKFTTARLNQYEQKNAIEYLEWVLDLIIYKPKPVLSIDAKTLDDHFQTIFAQIDHFFADYEEQPVENVWKLKNNVALFILALVHGDQTKTPRYIYFHGLGGIGKTYFANQLSQWIEASIPGSVRCENIIISNSDELEGTTQRPGTMLRVLRNLLRENKRGAVVFMDEASWLNKPDMVSIAKRVFNGDQSKLVTSYFGTGVEGTGLDLSIPPMLICVAGNDDIADPALKNRFDIIEFPAPKKEALIRYARHIAEQNELIKGTHALETFDFDAWFNKTNIHNFRDIASQIVPAILSAQNAVATHP